MNPLIFRISVLITAIGIVGVVGAIFGRSFFFHFLKYYNNHSDYNDHTEMFRSSLEKAELTQVIPQEDIWESTPMLNGSDLYRLSPSYLSDAVVLPLLNNVLYGKEKQALHMNPLQSGRILKHSIEAIWMEKSSRQLVVDARVTLYPELGVQSHADVWQLIFKVHHDRPVEPIEVLRAKMMPPPIPVDQLLPFSPADPDTLSALHPASL